MTLLITMATKNGIVMGADSKISMWNQNTKRFITPVYATKIVKMETYHMAASFWGLLDIPLKHQTGTKHLINEVFPAFIKEALSNNDNVDTVSEKFRDYVNTTIDVPKLKDFVFGIHMAGYVSKDGKKEPKIRHVCLSPNDDKDPNQKDPNKYKSNDESHYSLNPPHAMVFNGFHYIVNALVNWVSFYYGDIYAMFNPQKMSMDETVNFTKYLINITKGFQSYARAPKLVGGCVEILTINEKGDYIWCNQKSKYSRMQ